MTTKLKKHHRLRLVLGIVLVLLILLYIVLVNVLVSAALVPSFMRKLKSFERVTEQSYAKQVYTSDIQKNHRDALLETRQWLQAVQDHTFRLEQYSEDGYLLVATEFLSTQESSQWVVLLHGYTGWKEEMYPFANWYYTQGYNVLVPDLRCQGESDGDFIGMGWTDRQDVLLWLNRILEADPDASIVIHGQSMGAACALMLSGMDALPEQVCAVVSDCAYTDAYQMFRQDIWEWFHLPAFPLVDSANLALQIRGGYDLKKASALDAVQKSKVPILIIHGESDKMVPVEMAKTLFSAVASEKRLLLIPGAGHAQSQDKDPETYYGTILEFLAQHE